jgi:hypothetical protein
MAILKRKTKKAISKQVRKMVKKHGPEVAMGVISSLVTGVIAAVAEKNDSDDSNNSGKSRRKKKKKDK